MALDPVENGKARWTKTGDNPKDWAKYGKLGGRPRDMTVPRCACGKYTLTMASLRFKDHLKCKTQVKGKTARKPTRDQGI